MTARALRRSGDLSASQFPHDVVELIGYLSASEKPVHPSPVPGSGYLPEIWLLGSSTFSAQLAGALGLPFSFAYHFAPALLDEALDAYRSSFRPSRFLEQPYTMVAVSVLCAPTLEEAQWLSQSNALSIVYRSIGRMEPLPSPAEAAAYQFSTEEIEMVTRAMSSHVIGDRNTVRRALAALAARTGADELMLSTRTHAYEARLQSFTLISDGWSIGDSY